MNDDQSDQLLVERAQQGNHAAFDLLVKKYQHRIISMIYRMVKSHDDALDIAQEVLIKAYRALPQFRGDSAFYTWLYRIAVNTAKNHLTSTVHKAQIKSVDVDDQEPFALEIGLSDNAGPEAQLSRDQLEQVINSALHSIPDDLKQALMLREFDGLSYEEIAEVMKCPIGTVRSRIFRARDAIDRAVTAFESGESGTLSTEMESTGEDTSKQDKMSEKKQVPNSSRRYVR
ncbi:MAG: RNA polymerase sigma factor RpoE [Pseudomonadota bacterium]